MARTAQATTARPHDTNVRKGWRRQWIGRWIMGVALIHTLFGIVVFGDILVDLIKRGLINTVGTDAQIGAPVWFLLFGVPLWMVGVAVGAFERSDQPIPATLGWGLLGLTVAGVVLMPASGFWLVLPAIAGILIKQQR